MVIPFPPSLFLLFLLQWFIQKINAFRINHHTRCETASLRFPCVTVLLLYLLLSPWFPIQQQPRLFNGGSFLRRNKSPLTNRRRPGRCQIDDDDPPRETQRAPNTTGSWFLPGFLYGNFSSLKFLRFIFTLFSCLFFYLRTVHWKTHTGKRN